MVRFIIYKDAEMRAAVIKFTFQYGQIYYAFLKSSRGNGKYIYIPIWLDLLCFRLIRQRNRFDEFTFQYGQIYYSASFLLPLSFPSIYIPIWLDLLYVKDGNITRSRQNLHSNMVRFIILQPHDKCEQHLKNLHSNMVRFIIYYETSIYFIRYYLHSNMVRFIIYLRRAYYFIWNEIYIPIWLDLLCLRFKDFLRCLCIYIPIWLDLLSELRQVSHADISLFTFQYGQIYYSRNSNINAKHSRIYIPIWLDLLSLQKSSKKSMNEDLHSNMVRFIISKTA